MPTKCEHLLCEHVAVWQVWQGDRNARFVCRAHLDGACHYMQTGTPLGTIVKVRAIR